MDKKTNAPSDNEDKYYQNLELLMLKIAELEDKFVKLEIELNNLVGKKKKRKKTNIVKCKCKGKMVDISKCKCKRKKLDR